MFFLNFFIIIFFFFCVAPKHPNAEPKLTIEIEAYQMILRFRFLLQWSSNSFQ